MIFALSRQGHGARNAVSHRPDGEPALVWELLDEAPADALLSAEVELASGVQWLLRCDRVDFPPGGVAYRHTHPGPGIRYLLAGALTIEDARGAHTYGPGEAWFEGGDHPVLATASDSEQTAFVRATLLPQEWRGRRTIRYLDPTDEARPKLQTATVFAEEPVEL